MHDQRRVHEPQSAKERFFFPHYQDIKVSISQINNKKTSKNIKKKISVKEARGFIRIYVRRIGWGCGGVGELNW